MEELAQEDGDGVRIRLTERTCAALSRLNVFVGYYEQYPPDPSRAIRIPKAARFEEYTSFLGDFHTSGAFSYSETPSLKADIGRYCSIAAQVAVFGERHPIERVTSSPITYCFASNWNKPQFLRAHTALLGGRHRPDLAGMPPFLRPVVGHDVWIGQHVQLAQGITIGTGAVIGAGAVVTKDVASYTIVGGNPAKPIRDRFPVSLADRLLATQWWLYDPKILWQFGYRNASEFCDQFDDAARGGDLPRLPTRTLDWRNVLHEIGSDGEVANSTPASPKILATHFDTTVFVDPVTGLRHGPHETGRANVFIDGEGPTVRLDCPGFAMGASPPADPQCDPFLVLGLYQKVEVSPAGFGLRKDALLLCAEPDGRVTLSRSQFGPWERFRCEPAVTS